MPSRPSDQAPQATPKSSAGRRWTSTLLKILAWGLGLAAASTVGLALTVLIALAVAYPNLPDVSDLADYRPKLPLRVFSSEGALLGEFGEERRNLTPIQDIPKVMKDAVLAIEDARFFQHGGVDYKGVVRAGLANVGRVKSQGASTITMQVARNVYLSTEKTFTRKIYEILLTFKLEHLLTKDQILEIYMNQIFLGNRAYGFAAASEAYFGKPLQSISIAEAAMLAGLPKAPSAYNPINNPKRARSRQLYIIERMEENGFITEQEAIEAKKEELKIRSGLSNTRVHAEYVAEMARQLIFAQYGNEAYTRGLNVYTTLNAGDQEAAYTALRRGIMDYERRQHYRGPEKFVALPSGEGPEVEDAIDEALASHPDNGDVLAAVVLEATAKKVVVARANGDVIEVTGDGLKPVQSGLNDKAAPNIKIRRGAVIRISKGAKSWEITQLPEVEGAFVALDPRSGAIKALVGGFDFDKNKFNHAAQAWRQPGSSFKPFIYSAALEKGFTPATVINDAPLFFDAGTTGGQPWEPKIYDCKYDGPMTMRTGLAKSKNMISIRILQSVGPKTAQEWVSRFGFDAEKHPAYLTMALGAGSVTPMQMAAAYSVFANGGYRVHPWLITKVTDHKGRVISETTPPTLDETNRAIDARNAFVMNSLLQEVTRSGTAARAQATLKRTDLAGKTGTTNDSVPAGVVNVGGDWFYEEYARSGVPSLGLEDKGSSTTPLAAPPQQPAAEERNRILDLFKN